MWEQFGGAIDMLHNAIRVSPHELSKRETPDPQYWYLAYRTLFFLDHAGRLNLLLRQTNHDAPRWVSRARPDLTTE